MDINTYKSDIRKKIRNKYTEQRAFNVANTKRHTVCVNDDSDLAKKYCDKLYSYMIENFGSSRDCFSNIGYSEIYEKIATVRNDEDYNYNFPSGISLFVFLGDCERVNAIINTFKGLDIENLNIIFIYLMDTLQWDNVNEIPVLPQVLLNYQIWMIGKNDVDTMIYILGNDIFGVESFSSEIIKLKKENKINWICGFEYSVFKKQISKHIKLKTEYEMNDKENSYNIDKKIFQLSFYNNIKKETLYEMVKIDNFPIVNIEDIYDKYKSNNCIIKKILRSNESISVGDALNLVYGYLKEDNWLDSYFSVNRSIMGQLFDKISDQEKNECIKNLIDTFPVSYVRNNLKIDLKKVTESYEENVKIIERCLREDCYNSYYCKMKDSDDICEVYNSFEDFYEKNVEYFECLNKLKYLELITKLLNEKKYYALIEEEYNQVNAIISILNEPEFKIYNSYNFEEQDIRIEKMNTITDFIQNFDGWNNGDSFSKAEIDNIKQDISNYYDKKSHNIKYKSDLQHVLLISNDVDNTLKPLTRWDWINSPLLCSTGFVDFIIHSVDKNIE